MTTERKVLLEDKLRKIIREELNSETGSSDLRVIANEIKKLCIAYISGKASRNAFVISMKEYMKQIR